MNARIVAGLLACAVAAPAGAELDWAPFRATSVIEILTQDEDGALRETQVWVVVLDSAYVRTNNSQWLANIRRGSTPRLRVDGAETAVRASEVDDAPTRDRVEAAFKAKYGLVQRVMSTFRMTEPTVLRLVPE